jgi:hypothetical protein
MVRATPFSQSDISKRREIKVEPDLLQKLVRKARVPEPQKSHLTEELELTLRNIKLRDVGEQQELPTRFIVTLAEGLTKAYKLLDWIHSLPPAIFIDVKAAQAEPLLVALTTNIKSQTERYKARVVKNRPDGADWLRESLQRNLNDIYQRYCPGRNGHQRDQWIADVLPAVKVPFPNIKKDKKRFRSFEQARLPPSAKLAHSQDD